MSGKGFGKPPSTPTPTPNPKNQFSKAAPPKSNADFIPRGPTLREEYEQKGYIEPALGRDAGVLPEIVANRMLRRILTFGGIPLIGLFSFFAAYFVLKYKYDITVIPVVVAYSTLGTIFFATVGISYGIFSTSWDYDVEGSALGWEQVAKNLTLAKDGLLNAKEREARDEEFFKLDEIAKASKKEEAKNERTSEDDQ